MRILYLPIFEGGSVHETALTQKRGLYTALAKSGHSVIEYDYLNRPRIRMFQEILDLVQIFSPELILSQLHGADVLSPQDIRHVKDLCGALFCNWSGDSWPHSLIAQPILDMAREFDLQLVAAPDALPVYEAAGVQAAYWNIAYEPPVIPLPDMPAYDVVFLANVTNDNRRALMEFLRGLDGVNVGIYGDWERADGRTDYDFAAGEALYQNAKLAIADNSYTGQTNCVSNRPMQVMGANCLLLHQHVPNMQELTGWIAGKHYVEWHDFEELERLIRHWIQPEQVAARFDLAYEGYVHTKALHSWGERVWVLFNILLPQVRERDINQAR